MNKRIQCEVNKAIQCEISVPAVVFVDVIDFTHFVHSLLSLSFFLFILLLLGLLAYHFFPSERKAGRGICTYPHGSVVDFGTQSASLARTAQRLRILWIYCPGHAEVKGNDRADRLAGRDSCGSTVLDMLESREMTEQIDWRAKTPVDLLSWTFWSQGK